MKWRTRRRTARLLLLLLVKAIDGAQQALPAAREVERRWAPQAFKKLLDLRAGTTRGSPVYWVTEGALSSPFTGETIAGVRGIQMICRLKSTPAELQTGKALQAHAQEWQAMSTFLAVKAFSYFDPRSGEEMKTYRASRRSKPRPVPSRVSMIHAATMALDKDGRMHLVHEAPDGLLVKATDEPVASGAAVGAVGGGVGAQGPSKVAKQRRFPWDPRVYEVSVTMWPGSKPRSGPLSWLIQVGGSTSAPQCRERYAVQTGASPLDWRPRMRYLRFGEAPWWCGPGRICQLSLESTRYDRLADVPRVYRDLLELGGEKLEPVCTVEEFEHVGAEMRRKRKRRLWILGGR